MFGNKHKRCAYDENAPAPFPVYQIPARLLQQGMTLVALPEGWHGVSSCCGRWPVIVGEPRHVERGATGKPSVRWTTDEPEVPGQDCGDDRSPHYWAEADLLVTVAA
jgi:hypothetical protein